METTLQSIKNVKEAAKIFEEYSDVIHSTIYCNVNNKSIIDDIFQDFFLALVHRPIPSGIQNVKSYLRRAVKNDILDEVVKIKNYHARNQRYVKLQMSYVKFHDPENTVIEAETIQQLFEIIEKRLFPHEAEAVTQKFSFDRDYRHAAEIMGINRRSFLHYLCTGLKKVRQLAQQSRLEQNIPA